MSIVDFEQQVREAQKRLDEIVQIAEGELAQPNSLVVSVTEELHVALEELNVALEEQQLQNEELIASQKLIVEERKRYQSLFEFAPDGYLVTDLSGVIREANWAASVLLGVPQEFLAGKPLTNYIVDDDRSKFRSKLNEFPNLRSLSDWEIRMQPRKRNPFPVAIAISTVRSSTGEITDLRWIIRDISRLKQAEAVIRGQLAAEKEISNLKTQIIQTISHEFRTPLTVIRTSAEILEHYNDRIDVARQKGYFRKIKASVHNITQLLEGVFVLDEAEANQLQLQSLSIDLKQFCQSLIEEAQLTSEANYNIHFVYEGEHRHANFDRNLLQLILSSLLSNAMKYSSDNSNIYLTLKQHDDQAIFQVQDEGIGIPLVDQAHLFEPFYKAKNSENFSGSGLGLAIAKKAVDLHGGTIDLHSEVNVGTTITVTLPVFTPTEINPTDVK